MLSDRPSLVRGVGSPLKRGLERWKRVIQGNFDHMDGVITQVQEKHNNLDDNVQQLVEHLNDVVADLEQRIYDLENP
jgi:uncharacterized protein YceH (UPF0502 family)